MKKLLVLFAFVFLVVDLFSQRSSRFEVLTNPDSLEIAFIQHRITKKSTCKTEMEPELRYDFNNQYPFYELPFPHLVGDSLEFALNLFPNSGFLYVYSFYPTGQVNLHATINLSAGGFQKNTPYSLFKVTNPGNYHLCFLYSKAPIHPDPERFVGSMEMTQGSFLFRQTAMLDSRLVRPQQKWQLLENGLGLVFEPDILKPKGFDSMLIYIKMEAQSKPSRN